MRLIELGEEYYNEVNRWHGHKFDPNRIMEFAIFAITDRSHQIFLAVDENNKILGFFWGCVAGHIWTSDPMGQDLFLYVRKEERGKGVAKAMIKEFIKWCEVSGCKSVQVGANSGIGGDTPAIKTYESLGFQPGGMCLNLKL
jgi:GNAT superfamily N-acetyltransferase